MTQEPILQNTLSFAGDVNGSTGNPNDQKHGKPQSPVALVRKLVLQHRYLAISLLHSIIQLATQEAIPELQGSTQKNILPSTLIVELGKLQTEIDFALVDCKSLSFLQLDSLLKPK
jgi:hypothetical protein